MLEGSERPKEIPKGLGCASFGLHILAEIHLPIQPMALSVVHYLREANLYRVFPTSVEGSTKGAPEDAAGPEGRP